MHSVAVKYLKNWKFSFLVFLFQLYPSVYLSFCIFIRQFMWSWLPYSMLQTIWKLRSWLKIAMIFQFTRFNAGARPGPILKHSYGQILANAALDWIRRTECEENSRLLNSLPISPFKSDFEIHVCEMVKNLNRTDRLTWGTSPISIWQIALKKSRYVTVEMYCLLSHAVRETCLRQWLTGLVKINLISSIWAKN